MNESGFWRWLRERLPPGSYDRIESPLSPGVPDVHYSILAGTVMDLPEPQTGWIELKATDKVTGRLFNSERSGLRAAQIVWAGRYVRHGGQVRLYAAIGPYIGIYDSWVFHQFNNNQLTQYRDMSCFWELRRNVRTIPWEFLSSK